MKKAFSKYVIYFMCHSANAVNLIVPFNNILLTPNQQLSASYQFGTHAMIFCYTDVTQNAGFISWPYQGAIFSNTLPITLTTSSKYQGSYADASGVIRLQNNQGFSLWFSCQYAF